MQIFFEGLDTIDFMIQQANFFHKHYKGKQKLKSWKSLQLKLKEREQKACAL